MVRGDHIYVSRGRRYTHHGIDCGDGSVIHYVGPRGSIRYVARTPLEEFAAGDEVRVRQYKRAVDAEETMRNAESLIGSTDYHLIRNNCEHFAAWCRTGRARSSQVRRWTLAAQGTASVAVTQAAGLHVVWPRRRGFLCGRGEKRRWTASLWCS
ncbi:lecithin retinol acyltransferase family protein [Nocardioides sp.]|uniref:lecithin retinol acyltransferase family protein n=1 Tax=Nocardioides sp. TaxID=35761 RepID=UPI0039E6E240